jgi:superfamily I DNA/RNA helicase
MTSNGRTWSTPQDSIFTWFAKVQKSKKKHLIVRARAGTGKTTTIIEGINRAPETTILLCAFNKRIAEELTARLTNPNAQAKTLHAVGYATVRRFWEGLRIASGSDRADDLALQVCGPTAPDAIKRLVSKLHTKGREIAPHATLFAHLESVAIDFECEPDETFEKQGFGLAYVVEKALAAMQLAATVKPVKTGIDFADMIFLPVRNHWLNKSYDLVVVDEAQDMTLAQLEIAQGVCSGRICVVGDDRQAIYGFRGADSESLDGLKTTLDAEELGLTMTYRCGRIIVEAAAKIVPDFECAVGTHDGEISYLDSDKLTVTALAGDFILSRKNAPLVSVAMSLLRSGKRTKIAGRDVGAGLKNLVRKLSKGRAAHSVPVFLSNVNAWSIKECDRAMRAQRLARVEEIRDQADMLISLTDGVKNTAEVEGRIDALFTDDGLGQAGVITCSSVHRAKGLEASRVFVLADTLRNTTKEEENITYVAITRAKEYLVWVTPRSL